MLASDYASPERGMPLRHEVDTNYAKARLVSAPNAHRHMSSARDRRGFSFHQG